MIYFFDIIQHCLRRILCAFAGFAGTASWRTENSATSKIHMRHFTATEERLNKYSAQSFTPFDYIYFDERMSSRLLCDLLSPNGKHGQKDVFLQSFLSRFTPLHYDGGCLHAQCEYRTCEDRSIDIALHWQANMLAIENKLWANDQKHQLQDYLKEISRHTNYYLLYLTRDGHEPEEYTLSADSKNQYAGRYGYISWSEVINWLTVARKDVESMKLRFFLEDLCNKLRANLNIGV